MNLHDTAITLAAFAGVLTLIALTPRLLNRARMLTPHMGNRLRVIEATAIDPKRRLVLAQIDGRDVLILTGGAADVMQILGEHT
jgi:flagellar protein FliO/FliZ